MIEFIEVTDKTEKFKIMFFVDKITSVIDFGDCAGLEIGKTRKGEPDIYLCAETYNEIKNQITK